MSFVRFPEVGLSKASTDREVWRLAQQHQMILLTANRKMTGVDSLEQTIREENTAESLPVLTIGKVDRLLDRAYRIACGEHLVEIVLDLKDYLGIGRLFIP